ncbi:MAG: response regulator transcription factor [Pseudolabrys sp.]
MARRAGFAVFVVDDDELILRGLSRLLRTAGYETVCFQSPEAFLSSYDCQIPSCLIADLSMGEMDGLQLQDELHDRGISIPLIFLTGTGDIPSSVRAMKGGAVDFQVKPVDRSKLLAAVARAEQQDDDLRRARADLAEIHERLSTLTPREKEVLAYVIGGLLNKQIAAILGTVEKTIKVHRGRMMSKLGVHSVADLVRLTARAGIKPAEARYWP